MWRRTSSSERSGLHAKDIGFDPAYFLKKNDRTETFSGMHKTIWMEIDIEINIANKVAL